MLAAAPDSEEARRDCTDIVLRKSIFLSFETENREA